jgi:hypothetical protein
LPVSNPDVEANPSTIREVFDSLAKVGLTQRRHIVDVDFHGDGRDGYVNIVGVDSKLMNGVNATGAKPPTHFYLAATSATEGRLHCGGYVDSMLSAGDSLTATRCDVGVKGEGASAFGGGVSHAGIHGRAPVADLRIVFGEPEGYSFAIDTKPGSKGFDAGSVSVGVDDVRITHAHAGESFSPSINPSALDGFGTGSALDASISKGAFNDPTAYTVAGGDTQDGIALNVFADEIVSISMSLFSGHVYNLETSSGYYSANGIIAHNCRCAVVAVLSED